MTASANIFFDTAPKYWAAGLPVIPLQHRDKMPRIKAWSQYADRMPSAEEQAAWLDNFADGNIGLPLGSTSGLVALDIDTDDPTVLGIIEKVFPPSPWKRVGHRGYVLLYRYTGQRAFKIKKADGTSLCDFLSRGQQVVLPPSIHPKTQAPYQANCELLDVIDTLLVLPANIEEVFKDALRQHGIETAVRGQHKLAEFISAGSRDNELVRKAGFYAHIVLRGERTLLEAMGEIDVWQQSFVEKVHGDELPEGKGREKLVEMLLKDVFGPRKRTLPAGWDLGLDDEQKKALGLGDLTEDNRRFSHVEIEDFITEAVSRIDPKNHTQVLEVAETVCRRLAGNLDISKLQEDGVLRFLSQVSGKFLNVASLRKRVNELRQGEIVGADHRELAKAMLQELNDLGEVRFHQGLLWQWRGSHWQALDDAEVRGEIIEKYGSYPGARKANDYKGILSTLKDLCSKRLREWEVTGINFVNGYLTEDLVLRPHDPNYGMTYVLPYPYLPELAGKTPMWLGMLAKYWGDDEDFAEKVEALQQAMAATLFGVAPRYQRAFLLFGVEGSGKSRILEIMRGLMPEDCTSNIPPSRWNTPFDSAEMAGKLLNVAGELDEHAKIDGTMFKQIVVGEEITAQRKHQPLFKYTPTAAQWFGSNHLPKSNDSSGGFVRRWLILQFNKMLSSAEKIPDYDKEVLYHERSAIAAWAVQGLVGLKAQGVDYTLPKSHLEQENIIHNQNDSVRFFLTRLRQKGLLLLGAHEHEGRSCITTAQEALFVDYRAFCIAEAFVSPVASQIFLSRMVAQSRKLGFQVVHRDMNGTLVPEFKYLTRVQRAGT